MGIIKSPRIQSIDILRGLVMVIMALDHVRDYFHKGALVSDPTNLDTTTPELFLTRFITHFCAPVFVFLAGTAAFLYGRNKSKEHLFKFLFTRGIWLIVVEIVIMNFLWWFDISYGFINLQVIWAIGLCMVILSILVFLPPKVLLVIGLLLIFGHNLLDGIQLSGNNPLAVLWYILHQSNFIQLGDRWIGILYPILPWVGVIVLGYCFGRLYQPDFKAAVRRQWLIWLGIGSLVLFFLLRSANIYGDMAAWSVQKDIVYSIISFFNVTKYPPSLLFLLVTLGPAFLFLLAVENIKNKFTDFLLVYGRVPFFYYVLHILIIHLAAVAGLLITGDDWTLMILDAAAMTSGELSGYGYSLWITYPVWVGVVALLYPLCLWYMKYKANNRDKWWLSYL